MRRVLFAGLWLILPAVGAAGAEAGSRPATAEETQLFKDALKNTRQDMERWAYTERGVMKASKGRQRGETVVRFDPSRPYAEQYTPLQVEGRPPTEKDLKKYRERGEKRGERLAKTAAAAGIAAPAAPQLRIGGSRLELNVDRPLVALEEAEAITYEVPVAGRRKDIPVEKFQILVRVNRSTGLVENVRLHLRESFRLKLVAKVKAGEASMDFRVVDPQYGPLPVRLTGDFGLSFLFMPLNATFERTRTEWQRVKPYDERFQVKVGPLEVLDF